jgi:hypothetical protein
MKDRKLQLPSKRSIEDCVKVIDDFRDVCRHQMDLGYWATTDFPSKHHINKILQLQYVNKDEILETYGNGLSKRINYMIVVCKSYVAFLREDNDKVEDKQQGSSPRK